MKYFFSWNTLDLDKIIRTNPKISGENFFERIIDHYRNVSEKLGYRILPNQAQVNDVGYYLLQKEDFEGAFLFFNSNINNYPKSSNAYDSMGDYYIAKGQKEKAAKLFSKAIAIDGNRYSKEKLEALKSKKPPINK